MTYEYFLEQAKGDIEKGLKEYGLECETAIVSVEKLQMQSYRGIQVRTKGEKIGTSLNLIPYWEQTEEGTSYHLVLDEIVQEILRLLEEVPSIDIKIPYTYEEIRNRLMFQIVSTEDNKGILSTLPHVELEDMSVVFRVDFGAYPDGNTTMLVTNEMMDLYGITTDRLYQNTKKIAPLTHPAIVKRLDVMMNELSGGMFPEEEDEDCPMYVVSTECRSYGAAAILYPGILEQISEELETDFFLLPSSLHEMILVKDEGAFGAEGLAQMVRDINASEINREDKLTDSVYYYKRKEQEFRLAKGKNLLNS